MIPSGSPVRDTTTSSDGTRLTYTQLGSGPPVVVCHGSFATSADWVPFATQLAETHTVHLYDRRGLGRNSAAPTDGAIDADVEDLAAMVAAAGPHTAVLGHSHGGGCALAFAARERFTGSLILYDPRHATAAPISRGHLPELERLVEDREAAVEFVMTRLADVPAEAVSALRGSPLWQSMIDTVHAFPGELRLVDSLAWRPGDLDGIAGQVTFLRGEQSPLADDEVTALQHLLPTMRTIPLPGQGHFAYATEPALLADLVRQNL
ncbi:alpha/beta fold hydrolase [Pseudonocardia sp. D17]|uniref:alpha/beta fold hydrolase n=1 Tax=Pseudonocardia sp. D17 TaxID=882661 RepID=UPI002B3CE142|nr:alpha/beta hydrolase [Pseudonocardia sp. D17]